MQQKRYEQKKINIRKERDPGEQKRRNMRGDTWQFNKNTPDAQIKMWHKTHCLFNLYSLIKFRFPKIVGKQKTNCNNIIQNIYKTLIMNQLLSYRGL